jgi:hypothetical protein
MAKIYVSSTYLDLQEHRAQVERVIRRMGHEDVAMEYYVAEDQRPVAKCLADVAACDVYVGIFAWRYGWIPTENNPNGWSITEMEYRRAEELKKPCLIFLLDGKAPWPPDFIDDDKTQIKRLRNELSEKHNTGPGFKSADELVRLVAEAIYKQIPATVPIPEHNLTAYYAALRKRYNALALEGLTPPQKEEYLQIQLRAVFVEQNMRENPPPVELPKEVWQKLARDKEIHLDDLPSDITLDDVRHARETYYERPSRPVLDVLTDSRYQHTIILGDPGSGKSTLARYVMLLLIDPATADNKLEAFAGHLPLLVELRTYAGLCAEGNCTTFLEFLEYLGKTEGWALTQSALRNHLKHDGRAVVIFDGLDEIFDPEMRERVTHQIVGFGNDYPKARIIVTSRVIGYRRKILTDAGFTHFTLQDLDEKQVETFVSRWYDLAMSDRPDEAKERRERILKSFKESASIRALAGNPMLLTIMAIIGKHQELPRERWKLYDHAASVLIQHWDINKHLKDARLDADFIGEEEKKELLRRLAFRMQGGDGGLAGNYIHREQLQAEFEGYLRERYAQTPDRAVTIARAMIEQFRERNFILSLYGANLYGFVHRAFLEFFCASALVRRFEKTQELTLEQLKHTVYGKHWQDQSWHEVLRLICGMFDPRWAGEIITHLVTEVNRDWQQSEELPWHIALALFCLSEVQNPGAIPDAADRVVDAVFALFEYEMADARLEHYHFMREQVRQGINALSRSFATFREISRFAERLAHFRAGVSAHVHADLFGQWVGQMGGGNANVHAILLRYLKQGQEYRVLVPFALAVGWHDDAQTLPLVRDRAINDESPNPDEERLPVEYYVREVAINALARYWGEEAETLALLRERAQNDPTPWLRERAQELLRLVAQD